MDTRGQGSDAEPPDALVCPITYTLFRDPVICVGDGRVYERDGLLGFWRHRPMADFFGGAKHVSAAMSSATTTRLQVTEWLQRHPHAIPAGWPTRDPGPVSTRVELDELARQIEQLALARAAADAAVTDGGDAATAQVRALCARVVKLTGRTPGGRKTELLGVYERDDDIPLLAGRCVYVQRHSLIGARQPMLWYAHNGFWHAGERQYLGQQTGWLIVGDEAAAPEHIVAEWRMWDDGTLWLAPRLRCVVLRRRTRGIGAAEAAGAHDGLARSEGGEDVRVQSEGGGEGEKSEEEDDEEEDEEEDEDEADEEDEDDEDDEEEDVALLREGDLAVGNVAEQAAARALALAAAAARVHLTVHSTTDAVRHLRALGVRALAVFAHFAGDYARCTEDRRINGRFAYVNADDVQSMMWWANGFWHVGHRAHLGQQQGALIAQSDAYTPEDVQSPWLVSRGSAWPRWEPVPGLYVAAGPAPTRALTTRRAWQTVWLLGGVMLFGWAAAVWAWL